MTDPSLRSRPWSTPLWAWLLFALALVVAWLFRCVDLPLKPLHSDESVNGWFTLRLLWPEGTFEGVSTGYYHYRPSDYHGPMLYYVNLVFFWLLGPTDVSLRLGTALTGVLAVAVLPLYRSMLGGLAVVAAALVLAVQPMDVYFSRTVIHEIYLVTGTLVFVGAAWGWWLRGGTWRAGLAAAGLATMFANKETALISVTCVVAAAAAVWLVLPWTRGRGAGADEGPDGPPRWPSMVAAAARWPELLAGLAVFWVLMILFFSSFFSFWEGVKGIFTTYTYWTEYGVSGRNQKKAFGYWLTYGPYVWPALVAGLAELGAGIARRERATLFLGGWFLSSYLVYSLIPYKTPWCLLNVTLPLALLAGCGVGRLWSWASSWRAPALVASVVLWLGMLAVLGRASHEQNFERYDDVELPYVYVQTVRNYMGMVELLWELDEQGGHDGELSVVSIDAKNPVRWYLYTRDWNPPNFRYYKKYPDEARDWPDWRGRADVFVCAATHTRRLERELGDDYEVRTFSYRPGREVSLFVPLSLWEPLWSEP
jgi:uncharacterized protein (TIGR03663 family)